ncbi:hypothetical protein ebA2788 [Aromatoleum aromaticum EbN1]|uniref:Uncharacterized protein n=1 Tax=Aromatoleum aromaticum (strain DSM 19018 / LMG 30748 / EbN1) TaxID=76114 RepID=Q5P4S2_AROAE|nr:hypothetical protein ebA2788 [Aromatoleum aromaticum EbN1]
MRREMGGKGDHASNRFRRPTACSSRLRAARGSASRVRTSCRCRASICRMNPSFRGSHSSSTTSTLPVQTITDRSILRCRIRSIRSSPPIAGIGCAAFRKDSSSSTMSAVCTPIMQQSLRRGSQRRGQVQAIPRIEGGIFTEYPPVPGTATRETAPRAARTRQRRKVH